MIGYIKSHVVRWVVPLAAVMTVLLLGSYDLRGADHTVQVRFDASKAGPRVVESLTEERILRDYRFAWTSLTQAMEYNTLDPLEGPFVGTAKQWLAQTVVSQRQTGLRSQYTQQNHTLEAVFYAPEGDVIELHDTAEYHLQVLDGDKEIHNEQVIVRYVVLMTPAADRWVIRQMQAVPQF